MKIGKFHVGLVVAIVCLALLASSFLLPWWTIERKEKSPVQYPVVYSNSTHDFKLLGVSTVHVHTIVTFGDPEEWTSETSYSDIEGSELNFHFTVLVIMMAMAAVLIVLFVVLHVMAAKRAGLRTIALILGFAVIFLALGSAAYLHANVPSAVGDSRSSVETALDTPLPDIQTFADSDLNETHTRSITTTWGPSIGWYSAFVVCVIMLFAIWFTESRPKTEEEPEEEPED